MTTMDEVRAFIGKDADLTQLNELAGVIDHAKRGRALSLPIGTRVRLQNIRPKYLIGLTGTIIGSSGDKVRFEPDVPQPRFGSTFMVGSSCVVPLA